MSEDKTASKNQKISAPKFEKPNPSQIFQNKFRSTFKPTARMGTINRSRR